MSVIILYDINLPCASGITPLKNFIWNWKRKVDI